MFASKLTLAVFTACAAFAKGQGNSTIVDIAVENGSFTTLVAAVTAAGLAETLSGDGPFTVLAPTDDAFDALPAGTVEGLLADIPTLTCILKSHVIGGSIPSADVTTGPVSSLSGHELAAVVSDGHSLSFDDAKVIAADIEASNGIIHVIDSVIVPESCVSAADEPVDAPATTTAATEAASPKNIVEIAVGAGNFQTLVAAVTAAGLAETLSGEGPFTVLAPTDDAFAALPEGTVESLLADIPTLTCILMSHVIGGSIPSADVTTGPVSSLSGHELAAVVSDGTVSFDDAKVVAADIEASNGIIHVIDSVIVPESCVSAADAPADEPVDAPATTTAAPTSKPTNEPTSSGTTAAATAAVISAGVAMMFI